MAFQFSYAVTDAQEKALQWQGQQAAREQGGQARTAPQQLQFLVQQQLQATMIAAREARSNTRHAALETASPATRREVDLLLGLTPDD